MDVITMHAFSSAIKEETHECKKRVQRHGIQDDF